MPLDSNKFKQVCFCARQPGCSLIAACAALARNYPSTGGRHEGALIIGAFLPRCGLEEHEIKLFADALAAASRQDREKRNDIIRTAVESARNQAQGRSVFGYPKLARFLARGLQNLLPNGWCSGMDIAAMRSRTSPRVVMHLSPMNHYRFFRLHRSRSLTQWTR
jgi:hypothetical protein